MKSSWYRVANIGWTCHGPSSRRHARRPRFTRSYESPKNFGSMSVLSNGTGPLLDGQHIFRKVTDATESLRTYARSLVDRRLGITADIGARGSVKVYYQEILGESPR